MMAEKGHKPYLLWGGIAVATVVAGYGAYRLLGVGQVANPAQTPAGGSASLSITSVALSAQ